MHGLVSILPIPYYEQVELLWEELEVEHNLQGIRVTPYPHFSWQIARDYDIERLKINVQDIAQTSRPFMVRSTGLGLFTGPSPVIYIPVVKDAALINLHTKLWESTQASSQGLSPFYSPEAWMPHISLAYEDVKPSNIGAVMEKLAFRSFTWEMNIDHIALIYEPEGQIGTLKFRMALSG